MALDVMDERVRISLYRLGTVLISIGLIDIAVMFYCIAHDKGYASSFNVLAVIAGVFLMRGSLKTARIVGEASSFLLAAFCGMLLMVPVMVPVSYVVAELRVRPISSVAMFVLSVALLVFLWKARQVLTATPVVNAIQIAGLKRQRSRLMFAIGIAGALVAVLSSYFFANTDAARAAIERVRREHGDNQDYFLSSYHSSMNGDTRMISATVTGYTSSRISKYEVSWKE
jgi:hypothetical protein